MAATLQPPQQINPQLKTLVYSKYREMLGSYNNKANTIVQSMPAYMVKEDKGFQFDSLENADRYQTQPCNAPPACVQNAMMTKDKKPFTYTPGGIDLSEIRSPRMAKRIARNAQYEGVTGPPKPSPLAAQNNTNSTAPPPPPPPMLPTGMPVQVFPTGPVGPAAKSSVPQPPPPPPPKTQLAPPNPPKASSPQNFEPPPFGCRPEIKIPPNPMATLRRVAPPRPKDDFWVEEYRKEKSRSPSYVPQNGDASSTNFNNVEPLQPPATYKPPLSETPQQVAPRAETPPRPTYTENTGLGNRPGAGQQFQPFQTPQQYTPPQQYQDRQQQQARPQQQQQPQTPKPQQQQYAPVQRRSPSPIRNVVGQHQHLQQKRTDSPFQSDDVPNLQRPLSPIKLNQGHSQEVMNNVQHNNRSKQPEAEQLQQLQSPNAKHVGTGSLYIPPVPPENLAVNKQKQQERTNGQSPQVQQSSPRDLPEKLPWMAQKQNKETPEWVRENEPDGPNYPSAGSPAVKSPPIQQFQQTQQTPSPFTFQPKVQSNNTSDGKERVIPIQFESQSPKVRTPPSAATLQDSSYNSPGNYTPPGYITRNPNQFVDQGYNNYPQQWQNANRVETPPARQQPPQQEQPYNWRTQNRVTSPSTPQQQQPQQQQQMRPVQNRVTSPPAQSQPVQPSWSSPQSQQSPPVSGVTRIIPIQIEGQESPFNPNSVRGPIMQSPAVIQNDPRTLHHQNSWGGATPNQSKSFKILQKITDTDAKDDDNADRMRRMQLNEQEQGRGKNQVPTSRQPTQRYVQPRPPYQYDDMQHPYIHPSEQQVPEMKMYAGSAIPSRSFKMLQAMTMPENAAETESSGVEYEQIYPHNCCSHPYPPYPYPFYPPPIDPNWHYYYPPPPPPYFYYYPEYDSQMIMNGKCWDNNKGKYYQSNNEQEPTEISYKDCDKDTPNIIVTTATTDEESREDSEDSIGKNYPKENSSVLNMLSKKLNEITSPDLNTVQTDDSLKQEQERKNSLNLKSFKTSLYDNSQSSEALSSDSECQEEEEEEEEEENAKSEGHIEGLKAIKSVTNIKVYETVDDVSKIGTESCESESESSEEEEEQSSSSSKHTTADDIDEDNASHDEDDDVDDITEDGEVAIKEQLSVIYEESEKDACSRNKSNSDHSNASTLNDNLTTIANDDDDVDDGDKKNDSDLIESSDSDECEDIETDTSIDEEYSDEDDDHDAGKKITVLPVEESLGKYKSNDSIVMKADIDCRNYDSVLNVEVKDNKESEDSEPENSSDKDEEDNEDNANMVTVRLPLKLSFSRSSNDEEITTVVVGTSEIQGEQNNTYRKTESAETKEYNKHTESDGSVEEEEETSDEDEEDCNRNKNDEPDVSVTISLPSRSNSTSKSPILLHNSSLDSVTSRDYNDCDSEISVSLSLPIKRNKSKPCAVEKISEDSILYEDYGQRIEVNGSKDWKNFENTNDEITRTTTEDVRETSPPFKPERYKELTTLQDISANFGVLLRNTVKNVDRSLRALSMSRMSDYEKSNDLITSVDTLLNKTTEIGSRYAQTESSNETRKHDNKISSRSRKTRSLSRDILKDVSTVRDTWESFKQIGSSSFESQKNESEIYKDDNESDGSLDSLDLFSCRSRRAQSLKANAEKETVVAEDSSEDEVVRIDKKLERLARSTRSLSRDIIKDTKQTSETYDKYDVVFRNNAKLVDRKIKAFSSGLIEGNYDDDENKPPWLMPSEPEFQEKYYDTVNDFTLNNVKTESTELNLVKSLSKDIAQDVAKLTESLNIFDNPTVNRDSEECDNGSTPINGSCEEQNLEEDIKVCVREKIAAFETAAIIASEPKPSTSKGIFTKEDLCKPSENAVLSRISSLQKSESEELEEDDSGVTSDMSKAVSETDTESECFPELRKMSRYQRASTHSRLFKLLQDEAVTEESSCSSDGTIQQENIKQENPKSLKSRKKIIHNVSITRRTNPEAIKDAETMSERRERLSLPLRMSTSIDADNLSSSNSPSSPTCSSHMISDKLVNELVQSLLLKKKSNYLSNLPMEKLQAAAKRVLEEEFDSLENTSLESTPALTPQEFKSDVSGSYSDYYDTWSTNDTARRTTNDIIPSKAFKNLQEQALSGKKRLWAARCPRVLSSKTINRDLARVTESRESESPDTYRSTPSCSSSNGTLDKCSDLARDDSSPKLGKV